MKRLHQLAIFTVFLLMLLPLDAKAKADMPLLSGVTSFFRQIGENRAQIILNPDSIGHVEVTNSMMGKEMANTLHKDLTLRYELTLCDTSDLIIHTFGSSMTQTCLTVRDANSTATYSNRSLQSAYIDFLVSQGKWDRHFYTDDQDFFSIYAMAPGNYVVEVTGFVNAPAPNWDEQPLTSFIIFGDDSPDYSLVPPELIPGSREHPFSLGHRSTAFSIDWSRSFPRRFKAGTLDDLYFSISLGQAFEIDASLAHGVTADLLDDSGRTILGSSFGDELHSGPISNSCLLYLRNFSSDSVCFTISGKEAVMESPDAFPTDWTDAPPGSNGISSTSYNSSPDLTQTTTRYFDGLGRPLATVKTAFGDTGNDVADHIDYDALGRPARNWIDGISTGSGGVYVGASGIDYLSTYGDTCAYQLTVYEASPLARTTRTVGPGEQWHASSLGKTAEYRVNTLDGPLSCFYFQADASADGEPGVNVSTAGGICSPGSLLVEVATDEDGGTVRTFKTASGETVLQRRDVDGAYADTYYARDQRGNLVAVLQPEFSAAIARDTEWRSDTSDMLRKYAWLYCYDDLNRRVASRKPGCEWERFAYDAADRLTFSQDGEMKKSGKWRFTLCDALGRQALEGICEGWTGDIDSIAPHVEFDAQDGALAGYRPVGVVLTGPMLLKATFYDNYSFTALSRADLAFRSSEGFGSPDMHTTGLATGSAVAVDSACVKWEAVYYDSYGHTLFSAATNHLGGTDRHWVKTDLRGNTLSQKDLYNTTTDAPVTVCKQYEFDRWDRQTRVLHSINGAGPTVISEFSYDAVGRMIGHSLGQYNLFSHFYNIRGWNTATTSRHWRQNLEYSPGGRIAAQQWWCWGPDDRTRRYDYRYDSASQLVAAAYSDNGHSYQTFSTEYSYDLNGNPLTIRREGKVGENFYQCIDDITLTYDGNRLVRASDAGFEPYFQGARHFIDGADLDTEYTYDALGRTLTDANKGITATVYDFNSRPRYMTFDGGNRTEWLYDAAATLLRTTHTVAMTSPSVPGMASADSTEYVSTVTDRLGDLIIEDGAVSRIVTDNGFALPDGAAFDYCFYVTDHQGNNRMVIDADGTVHRIEHYYPFGLSFEVTNFTSRGTTSRRSFGGKEFDRTSGLDLYDQEARQYDPALLRFTRPDDLGDKYLPISPFSFCLNNPVLLTDPSGEIVIAKTSDEQEMITSTINEYDRKHVEFDDNGVLNTTKLLDNISASGNYGALIALAVSVIEVNIVLDDKFISKNNIGEISETPMGTIDYDDYYKKDTPIAPKDIVTGETGRSGITCLPGIGESGINSTHDCKIDIVVNIALSDNGRAQALSHEAYGHAAMYVRTKSRKMSRHEFRNTNIDHNFLLSKEIQRAILETISIQKK